MDEDRNFEILDDVGALVVVLDEEGRIVHWNEACSRLTGYDRDEARGEQVWDFLLVSEEAEAVKEEFARTKEASPSSEFENYWVTREGEKRWISWSNSSVTGSDGETQYVVATGIDRTQAKRTREKLRASRAELRSIFALAPDAIVVIDEDQQIVRYNRSAERIFGWKRDEAVGQPLDILIPDRFRDVHRQHVGRFAEESDQARRMGEASSEIRGLRRNGEEFPAEAAISQIERDDGTLYTVTLRDQTERKSLEESLRSEIEHRDELMRRIVHDLRNPLNSIALQSRLLQQRAPDSSEKWHEPLGDIRDASDLMERLLDDLLDTAKSRQDNLETRTKRVDLASVVSDALSREESRAGDAEVILQARLPGVLPPVQADPIRLMQVFENLVGNAIKFTPEGGEVRVTAEKSGGEVVVTVTDTGPGLDADELEHAFEPFWQGDSRDRRGSGLGLANVESIVDAHGGSIRAENSPDGGARFQFTLPLVD